MAIARLTKRSEFLRAARGRKYAAPGLILQAYRVKPEADEEPRVRVGFTASKKVGNAVFRNRAKRRLRAIAAEILPEIGKPGTDYVFIARTETIDRPYDALLEDARKALHMVSKPRKPKNPRSDEIKGGRKKDGGKKSRPGNQRNGRGS